MSIRANFLSCCRKLRSRKKSRGIGIKKEERCLLPHRLKDSSRDEDVLSEATFN